MSPKPLPPDDDALPGEHRRVAVAVVINRGRVLVGRRPLSVAFAGYAEFPGGKVEDDESPQQTVVRECEEEARLQVQVVRLLDVAWQRYEDGDVELHFFECETLGDAFPLPPYEWVPIERLPGYRFPPANETVLRLLRRQADN